MSSDLKQRFVGHIDYAKAEVQARFGQLPPAPRNPKLVRPSFPSGTIFRPRAKSLRQLAIESGLYAQIEAQKASALTSHLQDVQRAIAPEKFALVNQWVTITVSQHIRTGEVR